LAKNNTKNKTIILGPEFYQRDSLQVAPELLGKKLARYYSPGIIKHYTITEVEVFRGEEDLACHASKGRTGRTEIMYHSGGKIYMYLIYGIHWMFNIVADKWDSPHAILIRGIDEIVGPGRVSKELGLDKSFYGHDISKSTKIWINDAPSVQKYFTGKRIGIDYSGDYWKNKKWRFSLFEI